MDLSDSLPPLGLMMIVLGLMNLAFFPTQGRKRSELEKSGLGGLAKFVPVTFWRFFLVRTLPLVVLGIVAIVVGVLTRG